MKTALRLAVSGAVLASSLTASAAEVVLTPSRDNTVYEEYPDNSNGAGYLFAGRAGGGGIRRSLLRFDVAAALPAGAQIESATLRLHVSRTQVPDSLPAALHRALADWGEAGSNGGERAGAGAAAQPGDATWSHRFYAKPQIWSAPGANFETAPSVSGAIGGIGFHSLSSAQAAADVQAWLDSPASNFGWVLRGDESSAGDARRIDSREHGTAANRPTLTVIYTAAAPAPMPRVWLYALAPALLGAVLKRKPLGR